MICLRRRACLALFSLCVLLGACADEDGLDRASRLSILIAASASANSGEMVLELRDARDRESVHDQYEVEFGAGQDAEFPGLGFFVKAPKGAPRRVTVVISLRELGSHRDVAQSKALVDFAPGRTALLRMAVGACTKICGSGETCGDSGECAPTPERSAEVLESD
jgi:hypothetical protein